MLSITRILVFCGLLTQLAWTQETPYPQSIRPSSKPDAVKDQRLANRSAPWSVPAIWGAPRKAIEREGHEQPGDGGASGQQSVLAEFRVLGGIHGAY